MKYLTLLFFILISSLTTAQKKDIIDFEILGNDTFFLSDLPQVEILAFNNNEDKKTYYILKKKVLKVYPYALIAKSKLEEIELNLTNIPKRRKKKRYTKEISKWVKEEYSDRLKKLTMSEGKILVKLIYRETNNSSYEILKTYRGKFNAFFWQTIAKFWDNNLKTEYDPVNIKEDMLIEHILIQAKIEGRFK